MKTQQSNLDAVISVNQKYAGAKTIKEFHEMAKEKAPFVKSGCQIRLTSDVNSYTILNMGGYHFIGFFYTETMKKMFKNKPIMILSDKDGKPLGEFQRLFQ